ncbi:MAG TPA: hypothetical protein CFH84_08850 [Sulfurimonas sp. UBA12504]|nr:MAG: hypothetical protein A2019_01090 [Sulfurimonas sp. GWF2_37_8]DAB29580.1 MAG TPA: hypothetical protein CFH84_08850 [Sulfurimonas sp. UBA12504]
MSVVLAQTDTTVGFLSQNAHELYEIKSRANSKPFIKVFESFASFKNAGFRVPKKHKNSVRRAKKTTFILKQNSFRIAPTQLHSSIIRALHWSYSTSANAAGKNFERSFCQSKADIIVEDHRGLSEKSASTILVLGRRKKRRLR